MTRREPNIGLISSAAFVAACGAASAQAALDLPPPRSQGGKPLIEALRLRRSIREYSNRALPAQVLSDLLWVAFGRQSTRKRRPHCPLLAPSHGDRHLCNDGGCGLRLTVMPSTVSRCAVPSRQPNLLAIT
jgi:hypothetical protein